MYIEMPPIRNPHQFAQKRHATMWGPRLRCRVQLVNMSLQLHSGLWYSERTSSCRKNRPIRITGWWFGAFFMFPYIGNVIIPIDELIFSRGVGEEPPTISIDYP